MRVNQTGNSPVQSGDLSKAKGASGPAPADRAKKTDEGKAPAPSTTIPGSTNTEISSRGKEMATAKTAAAAAPDVREDKIAALKARIADGGYKIDADAIADRMFDDHLGMARAGSA